MSEPAGSAVIVAVDQGTSSTKALAVDVAGNVVGWASVPIGLAHPRAGWVEQNADEIADSVVEAIRQALEDTPSAVVAGLALSTQRESAVLWDRVTGEAIGPVLGWQDRRTLDAARILEASGHGGLVRSLSGLPIDPMFSALKFAWLLDHVDPDRARAAAGELALGTVDAWLVHRLTGEFRIEAGNASRTALLDLATLDWSDELLELFRIPRAALPRIAASTEPAGPVTALPSVLDGVRIHAVLGDSHAALFGHGARTPGAVKVTLGTGSSIMGLVDSLDDAPAGLVTTIGWVDAVPAYAFEGNILSTGGTLVWLAELFGVTAADIAELAREAAASASPSDADPAHGVDLVPAFSGLGAPWWDETARAVICGFDLATTQADLARAALESVALQIEDVLAAAEDAGGARLGTILIDGGPASNDHLVQLLADLSQREVRRPDVAGLSALGAAHLAGIGAGVWTDADVLGFDRRSTLFTPALDPAAAAARRDRWHRAVGLSRASGAPSASPSASPAAATAAAEAHHREGVRR